MPVAPPRHQHLSLIEERRLVRRCRQGDRVARERLITAMAPLVHGIARPYARGRHGLGDLEQVGNVGLIKAIDRFDASRGTRLATYAYPTISGEIRRYLRDASWSVHVPRQVKEVAWRLPQAERELTGELHRRPTPDEIADTLGCASATVDDARLALNGSEAVPIDGGPADRPGMPLGAEDPAFERCEIRLTLEQGLQTLDPVERQAIELRYGHDLTQRQIADAIGCSQMQVSRLLARAVVRLRDRLAVDTDWSQAA